MGMPAWRVVAIVAALAAVVAFVPQGGSTAGFVAAVITVALTVMIVWFGARLYQAFRFDIYGLGDGHRLALYAAVGGLVLAMAWRAELLRSAAGTLLWLAMIVAVLAALYAVWVRWRANRV